MDKEVGVWEKEARGLVDVPATPNPPPPAYSKPLQTHLSLGWQAGQANDEMIAGGKNTRKDSERVKKWDGETQAIGHAPTVQCVCALGSCLQLGEGKWNRHSKQVGQSY